MYLNNAVKGEVKLLFYLHSMCGFFSQLSDMRLSRVLARFLSEGFKAFTQLISALFAQTVSPFLA